MNRLFRVAMLTLAGGALMVPPASSQGISGIISKLESLESRLGKIEAATRANEASVAESGVAEAAAQEIENLDGSIDALRLRTVKLEELVARLQEAWPQPSVGGAVEELIGEFRALVEEVRALAAPMQPTVQGPPLDDALVVESTVAPVGEVANGHEPEEATQTPPPSLGGVSITGFVDGSFFREAKPVEPGTFALDQVELRIAKELSEFGSVQVDVEWVSDEAGGFRLDVEQGFVTFAPSDNVELTFGKFNAPIGFELLDAPDMYQFSHALVFNYGLPTNLTGAMLSVQLNPKIDLVVHASNGWDQNVDLSQGKTLGARLGFAINENASVGISGMVDSGVEEGAEKVSVLDVDLTLTPRPDWTLGAELNIGTASVGGVGQDWSGFLIMGHHDFTDRYGLTLRYDYFDDAAGSRLGSGIAEVRQALTLAPIIELGHGMEALLEIRADWSDQTVFHDASGPADSLIGVAFQMTYSF